MSIIHFTTPWPLKWQDGADFRCPADGKLFEGLPSSESIVHGQAVDKENELRGYDESGQNEILINILIIWFNIYVYLDIDIDI